MFASFIHSFKATFFQLLTHLSCEENKSDSAVYGKYTNDWDSVFFLVIHICFHHSHRSKIYILYKERESSLPKPFLWLKIFLMKPSKSSFFHSPPFFFFVKRIPFSCFVFFDVYMNADEKVFSFFLYDFIISIHETCICLPHSFHSNSQLNGWTISSAILLMCDILFVGLWASSLNWPNMKYTNTRIQMPLFVLHWWSPTNHLIMVRRTDKTLKRKVKRNQFFPFFCDALRNPKLREYT